MATKSEWVGYAPIKVKLLALYLAYQNAQYCLKGCPILEGCMDHSPVVEVFNMDYQTVV